MLSLLNLAAREAAKKLPIAAAGDRIMGDGGDGAVISEALEAGSASANAGIAVPAATAVAVTSNRKTAQSLPLAMIKAEFFRTPQPALAPEAITSGMQIMATAAAQSPSSVDHTGVNIHTQRWPLIFVCYCCSCTLQAIAPY